METSNTDVNHAVFHSQINTRSLGPIETCYSGPKLAVLHAKTTDESWNPLRLVILVLITLFCIHNITGEVWDP